MISEGSMPGNFPSRFTELCIYRAGCGGLIPEIDTYLEGELVVSGFNTSTTNEKVSNRTSPCAIRYNKITDKFIGNDYSTVPIISKCGRHT